MLYAVPIDIMVRPDRLPELLPDDHPGTFCGWSTGEQHDSRASVREGGLECPISRVQLTVYH
jgi:hypothetical protein